MTVFVSVLGCRVGFISGEMYSGSLYQGQMFFKIIFLTTDGYGLTQIFF
jgi:hypothetical protein